MIHFSIKAAATTALFVFIAACCHKPAPPPPPPPPPLTMQDAPEVLTDITVKITRNRSGGYDFQYSGDVDDTRGNLDFRRGPAAGNPVKIDFAIDPASVEGIKFMARGEDAIWIATAAQVGENGSPQGPYQGEEFFNFTVKQNRTRLHVQDWNQDGVHYRYSLRFMLGDELVVDDPDLRNDRRTVF